MIKVRSKTLFVPSEEQSIGASGEAESTVREFHIDRVSGDGVDLANLLFKLNIRYAGVRDIDRSDLEKVITDNEIILRWLISSVTMSHAGTAFIQLDAFDNTGSCRWKSYPCAVYIEKSLGNAEIPSNTLSELEQLEKKFAKVKDGEDARVEAEKKRVIAEEKREEAEGKRNTSLANIIAEEEKIKALSTETKGYRDSVASDKASVETLKANVQELKADTENIKTSTLSAVETVKTEINRDMATAKNEVNDTIALAKTELNNTLFVARTDLGSMVSEGTKIKGEISTLKSEVNTVKEEAINAKNEAVTAKNGASTVKEEITAIKVEISASAEKAKQNADKAESSANTAKTAETNAEVFKTEAGKSAEKAKESETKTLEALKKAQEGGKVAGVTTEEMHNYVDTAVGKVKSGITEAEAIAVVGSELKKKEVPENDYKALGKELITGESNTFEDIGRTTLVDGETLSKVLSGVARGVRERFVGIEPLRNAIGTLIAPHVVQMIDDEKMVDLGSILVDKLVEKFDSDEMEDVFPYGKLATTNVLNALHSALKKAVVSPLKEQRRKQGTPYRDIADLYDMQGASTLDVVKEINKRIREDNYGDIRLGDYINVKLNGLDKTMRFVVVGIDFYKDIKTHPNIDNPNQTLLEKVPLKHIDFVCIDTDLTLGLNPEETKPSAVFARETRCFVPILVCKTLLKDLKKDNLDFFNELASKPCLDLTDGFNETQPLYTFLTRLPLWVPTPEEVTGRYTKFKDGKLGIDSSKMALQYPYFAEHPEVIDDGYYSSFKPKVFSYSYGNVAFVYVTNGNYLEIPVTKVFEKVKGSDKIYIPLGFRLDGKQLNGSIIPPA